MNASWIRTGALLAVLSSAVVAQIPTVTITATGLPPKTLEPCPVCLVAPVVVNVARTGSTAGALTVHLVTGGTATPGVDYATLPSSVVIPAGRSVHSFYISALDDHLLEGPEVVEVSVRDGTALYNAGTPSRVLAVIGDDDAGAPSERLDLTHPANGTAYPSGVSGIRLEALAVSTTREIDVPVEFFANGVLVGQSNPIQFGRPPIPCLPREHEFIWHAPADGQYILTARTAGTAAKWLEAPSVHITVGPVHVSPEISIQTTSRFAEEDSSPTMRPARMRGAFTVSRTGSTAHAQPVYLHVSGTATPGTDYTALPFMATIPAGSASTVVMVDAIPDNLAEPLETVVVELSNCPPGDILPPCYDFEIDGARQHATVLIRDDGITTASLQITAPAEGQIFAATQAVTIDVTALDGFGGITRVEFYAGNTMIGISELLFLVAPAPAEPVFHTFTWDTPLPGVQVLTARAVSVSGTVVTSPPVRILMGGDNFPPQVAITQPAEGSQIPSGTPIHIVAAATDPDGYAGTTEFYSNGQKIGEVTLNFLVPPPPGQTQTFDFTWNDPPPGTQMLSARSRDDQGNWGLSPPVTIVVTSSESLPVITAHPLDPYSVEPTSTTPANPGSFLLRRHGPVASSLSVNYSMHGSATNGTDYTLLNGFATFAAGQATVTVPLAPLADNLTEGRETAMLKVEPQFDGGPERYRVGQRRRAIVLIADRSWHVRHKVHEVCSVLGDGHLHLCFRAAPALAPTFRLEATEDFRQWDTIHEAASVESALHFVDPETPEKARRFYRMVPNTAGTSP